MVPDQGFELNHVGIKILECNSFQQRTYNNSATSIKQVCATVNMQNPLHSFDSRAYFPSLAKRDWQDWNLANARLRLSRDELARLDPLCITAIVSVADIGVTEADAGGDRKLGNAASPNLREIADGER